MNLSVDVRMQTLSIQGEDKTPCLIEIPTSIESAQTWFPEKINEPPAKRNKLVFTEHGSNPFFKHLGYTVPKIVSRFVHAYDSLKDRRPASQNILRRSKDSSLAHLIGSSAVELTDDSTNIHPAAANFAMAALIEYHIAKIYRGSLLDGISGHVRNLFEEEIFPHLVDGFPPECYWWDGLGAENASIDDVYDRDEEILRQKSLLQTHLDDEVINKVISSIERLPIARVNRDDPKSLGDAFVVESLAQLQFVSTRHTDIYRSPCISNINHRLSSSMQHVIDSEM